MNRHARTFTALAAACVVLGSALPAHAEDKYPSKPVKIVVPYAPGGPNDIVARLVASKLTEMEGQPFLVENKPGGGSNVGADAVVKSPADGYTCSSSRPRMRSTCRCSRRSSCTTTC